MAKNEQLDSVFDELIDIYKEEAKSDIDFKGMHKIRDGIICENCFEEQKERILFICKDHNNIGLDNYNKPKDFRYWWCLGVSYMFAHRIASWSMHILNNFNTDPKDFTYENKFEALGKIAFINIKKISGGPTINHNMLNKFIAVGKEKIRKQIDIIDPTIIICCLNNIAQIEELLDIKFENTEQSNTFASVLKGKTKVFNFYHPSVRGRGKSNTYLLDLLKNTLNKFENL